MFESEYVYSYFFSRILRISEKYSSVHGKFDNLACLGYTKSSPNTPKCLYLENMLKVFKHIFSTVRQSNLDCLCL
jgi:hypothetical protein